MKNIDATTESGLSPNRAVKIAALVAGLALFAAACGGDDGGSASGESGGGSGSDSIEISGSSTVEPISSLVAAGFNEANPHVGISVSGPGTGDGFEVFCNADTDISDASRPIKEEEIETCEANGVDYVELMVGIDGITIITSPDNKAVECIDNAGIYALVGPESTGVGNWADAVELADGLGSGYADQFPDASLDITGPGEESGTYDTFVELTIEDLAEENGQDAVTRPDYTPSANDNVIIDNIAGSSGSFGWVGYSFFAGEEGTLKAISVDGGDGNCVTPDHSTIADGTYPLARPLFIYVNTDKAAEKQALADFVEYYLSDVGYEAVSEARYVQLTDDVWAETQATWSGR